MAGGSYQTDCAVCALSTKVKVKANNSSQKMMENIRPQTFLWVFTDALPCFHIFTLEEIGLFTYTKDIKVLLALQVVSWRQLGPAELHSKYEETWTFVHQHVMLFLMLIIHIQYIVKQHLFSNTFILTNRIIQIVVPHFWQKASFVSVMSSSQARKRATWKMLQKWCGWGRSSCTSCCKWIQNCFKYYIFGRDSDWREI